MTNIERLNNYILHNKGNIDNIRYQDSPDIFEFALLIKSIQGFDRYINNRKLDIFKKFQDKLTNTNMAKYFKLALKDKNFLIAQFIASKNPIISCLLIDIKNMKDNTNKEYINYVNDIRDIKNIAECNNFNCIQQILNQLFDFYFNDEKNPNVECANVLFLLGAEMSNNKYLEYIRHSIYRNNIEVLREIINRGFPINEIVLENSPLIVYTITSPKSSITKLLIEHGVNLQIPLENKKTLLMLAARNKFHNSDNVANLEVLLSTNQFNIDQKDDLGNTALHYAVESGSLGNIKFLVDNKANINIKNNKGKLPYMMLIGNYPEISNYLTKLY
jgi:hypothetical protein